jgi:hypothetical protein
MLLIIIAAALVLITYPLIRGLFRRDVRRYLPTRPAEIYYPSQQKRIKVFPALVGKTEIVEHTFPLITQPLSAENSEIVATQSGDAAKQSLESCYAAARMPSERSASESLTLKAPDKPSSCEEGEADVVVESAPVESSEALIVEENFPHKKLPMRCHRTFRALLALTNFAARAER